MYTNCTHSITRRRKSLSTLHIPTQIQTRSLQSRRPRRLHLSLRLRSRSKTVSYTFKSRGGTTIKLTLLFLFGFGCPSGPNSTFLFLGAFVVVVAAG